MAVAERNIIWCIIIKSSFSVPQAIGNIVNFLGVWGDILRILIYRIMSCPCLQLSCNERFVADEKFMVLSSFFKHA